MKIQQSTTAYHIPFLMVQSADHITGLTGASPTVTLSKNCAAFGAAAGAVTEIANGWYKLAGNATDSNTLGPLAVHATAASGDPTDMLFEVVAQDLTTAVVARVTLTDTVTTYTGNTPQTGDTYARVGAAGAGLTALGDTRIANLDATISSRTKPADTQARVTLADTLTTYTGNTPQTGDAYARIGAAGAGLTAVGDARLAHLDADISSRTKPADTQAAVTLVTTTTNLTNAPTVGDLTAAMKASVNAEADTALADYDAPTHTELTAELATADDAVLAAIAALNNLSSAGAQAAAAAALTAYAAAKTSDVPTAAQNATAQLAAAAAAPIAANVKKVNDVALTGDGDATPWGPA